MIDEKKLIDDLEARKEYWESEWEKDKRKSDFEAMRQSLDMASEIAQVIAMVRTQPKVGEWIPVTERLPEGDGIYIVDDRVFDEPWVHTAGFVKTSQCWAEHSAVYYDDKYYRYDDGRIVAWQPLPEPYRGE